jgi:hypothetical protein
VRQSGEEVGWQNELAGFEDRVADRCTSAHKRLECNLDSSRIRYQFAEYVFHQMEMHVIHQLLANETHSHAMRHSEFMKHPGLWLVRFIRVFIRHPKPDTLRNQALLRRIMKTPLVWPEALAVASFAAMFCLGRHAGIPPRTPPHRRPSTA